MKNISKGSERISYFADDRVSQAYVQTNDDNIEKDTQTEETTSRDKWTQHPAGVDAQPFGGLTVFLLPTCYMCVVIAVLSASCVCIFQLSCMLQATAVAAATAAATLFISAK